MQFKDEDLYFLWYSLSFSFTCWGNLFSTHLKFNSGPTIVGICRSESLIFPIHIWTSSWQLSHHNYVLFDFSLISAVLSGNTDILLQSKLFQGLKGNQTELCFLIGLFCHKQHHQTNGRQNPSQSVLVLFVNKIPSYFNSSAQVELELCTQLFFKCCSVCFL